MTCDFLKKERRHKQGELNLKSLEESADLCQVCKEKMVEKLPESKGGLGLGICAAVKVKGRFLHKSTTSMKY